MKRNGEFVGVDEKFIPENEKYVEDGGVSNKTKKTAVKVYVVFIAIFAIFFLGTFIFNISQILKIAGSFGSNTDGFGDIQNKANEIKNEYNTELEKTENEIGQFENKIDKMMFNAKFEVNGTKHGISVKTILDDVVTNNKTNNRIITVIYKKTNTTDPVAIVKLKKSFADFTQYEVMVDYDSNGYVNKITIENI